MKVSYYNSEDDYIKYIDSLSYMFQKILNMVFVAFLLFSCITTVFKNAQNNSLKIILLQNSRDTH